MTPADQDEVDRLTAELAAAREYFAAELAAGAAELARYDAQVVRLRRQRNRARARVKELEGSRLVRLAARLSGRSRGE